MRNISSEGEHQGRSLEKTDFYNMKKVFKNPED